MKISVFEQSNYLLNFGKKQIAILKFKKKQMAKSKAFYYMHFYTYIIARISYLIN